MELHYLGDKLVRDVQPGQTLLEISLQNKIPHMRECGGRARCTTCRVRVLEGLAHLSPRNEVEGAIARLRHWDPYIRLACQTEVFGPATVQRLVTRSADIMNLHADETPVSGGVERHLAILFADLRGFTPFAGSHLPYDVVHILNRYYAAVCEPILHNGGFIDKYIGDAVLALFGAWEEVAADAATICRNALRAALGMQAALEELNPRLRAEFEVEFRMGIGIHYGLALLGRIGHPSKQNLTVIGDTVNMASRLESEAKSRDIAILLSDDVVRALPGELRLGPAFETHLRGTAGPSLCHPLLGFLESDPVFLVQSSFEQVRAQGAMVGTRFYEHLFRLDPALRALFPDELGGQAEMLMQMLDAAVQGWTRLDDLLPGLHALGQRHARYGVRPEHYPLAEAALLRTLEESLPAFTPDHRRSWQAVMQRLCAAMVAGSQMAG